MSRSTAVAAGGGTRADRLARAAERLLRLAADPRLALALLLLAGAWNALLVACLAVALWLPRRRLTVRAGDGVLRLLLRGERFDHPDGELAALRGRIASALTVDDA